MNPLPHSRLLLAAAVFLAAFACTFADEPAVAPAAPATVMIADLRKNAADVFSYSTWKDKLNPTADGLVVVGGKGAQGDGGLGRGIAPPLDLSRATFIEVALGVGALNELPEVTIALNDADGSQVSARIRIDQVVPKQPVWFRVRLSDFTPVNGVVGTAPGMDWTSVVQWHLQGDWTTKKPFQAVFIALRARMQ
jgi:hypothetical protein